MIRPRVPGPIRASLLALAMSVMAGFAGNATTQDDILNGKVLTGWQTESGTRIMALLLTLAPGWKTYWRSPGDAGIAPEFDWSASSNVKSVQIYWPAPSVFETAGFRTIGYRDELLLPVEVTPHDAGAPVDLEVAIDLGICRDICLPATVTLSAQATAPGAPDATILAALADVPRSAQAAGLTGITCTVEPIKDGLRVTARLDMPAQGAEETVAIETPDPRIWVSEADSARSGGTLTAVADLVPPQAAPFALDQSSLTVTVISASGAVEAKGCPAP